MSFFVSDELKGRVSEEDLAEIYHEEPEVDISVFFYCDRNEPHQCNVSSVEKNLKQRSLILSSQKKVSTQ